MRIYKLTHILLSHFLLCTYVMASEESSEKHAVEGRQESTITLKDLPRVAIVGPTADWQEYAYLEPVNATGPTGISETVYVVYPKGAKERLLGVQKSTVNRENEEDPAIRYYNSDMISIKADKIIQRQEDLQQYLFEEKINKLNLSNIALNQFSFLWERNIDLSCIRSLDVSSQPEVSNENNANNFLKNLLENNKTLRSLTTINVGNSNVTYETLSEIREKITFNGPLIRDKVEFSSGEGYRGWRVAKIFFTGVKQTSVIQNNVQDKINLQRAVQKTFDVKYREHNYEALKGHLQFVLQS